MDRVIHLDDNPVDDEFYYELGRVVFAEKMIIAFAYALDQKLCTHAEFVAGIQGLITELVKTLHPVLSFDDYYTIGLLLDKKGAKELKTLQKMFLK